MLNRIKSSFMWYILQNYCIFICCLQESGRAGRDGKRAECILMYRLSDVFKLSGMVFTQQTGLQNLYSIVEYCLDAYRYIEFSEHCICNIWKACVRSATVLLCNIYAHCLSLTLTLFFKNYMITTVTFH